MEVPHVIQFFIEKSDEGGYTASAVGFSIHTEGETLGEVAKNIKEAAACHFGEETE